MNTIHQRFIILCFLSVLGFTIVAQPLPVIENLHEDLDPFTPVNPNYNFAEEPTLINVNGRTLEVPPQWSYTGDPEIGGLPPYISRSELPGYRFDFSWINGQAGFAQDGIQLFGDQRYVVRVVYRTNLEYTVPDVPFVPSDFQVKARIYTAQDGMLELPAQSMDALKQTHEIEWVIESEKPYPFVRLEVLFDVKWPVFYGTVNLDSVSIETAPADYRPEFVLEF